MFEYMGPGFMLSSLTLRRRPRPQLPSRLLVVILALIPALVSCTLQAQTTNPQEISSHDVEPTFKLQTERNLVMVRVVVRDAKGAAVDNLRQEDFQLFDHGKLQTILHFSMEKSELKAAEPLPPKPAEKAAAPPEATDETAMPTSVPHRFVALYFDDVNTPLGNMEHARDAADHFLTSSLQPGDRVALYTASGQKQVDFTDNLAQVRQALFDLRSRPIIGEDKSCGAIPPYEAFLIVDHQDTNAIAVATNEILYCILQGGSQNISQEVTQAEAEARLAEARSGVKSEAIRSLAESETQSIAVLQGIESVVRRLASLPGQRSVIIVSGGFLTETLRSELGQIADRALRGGVILNAIDARGLRTETAITDASRPDFSHTLNGQTRAVKGVMLMTSAQRQTDGMQFLALDTGGVFFNNSNDLEAGFRQAASPPKVFYLLAFSPQNLKLDGAFHPLQVKLVSARGLSVQARRGYYAPRKSNDPSAQEKEEIQEAVFSQGEMHELPIDVHTQFFMKSESDARMAVQTSLDVRQLHLRKEGDRNLDNLTFVTVLFDQDGHVVSAQQRWVELRLRDSSLENLLQTGIAIQTLFDVKPGTYLVRAVVRDSGSGQISGLNRTVEIPY